MSGAQLLFVTGKGGVGKTTVAAALGRRLARGRRRVLVVESAGDGSLAARFGQAAFATDPARLDGGLHGVRLDSRALVESYFRRLLRLPFLSRRLFASPTFQAVTAAAPGVTEFVMLEHVLHWTEPGRFARRPPFDTVIVDGPASGHAVRLLRTPRQLGAMVPAGPIASTLQELDALLADHARTQVLLVAIPDEMAITEAVETRAALAAQVGIGVARPVLNRVWPKRFTATEARAVRDLSTRRETDPLLAAARLQLGLRAEVERHLRRLHRVFGVPPVSLRQLCGAAIEPGDLDALGRTLERAVLAS